MSIGESKITNMVLRMLGPDIRNEIDNYIEDVVARNFMVMDSIEQVFRIFNESLSNFLDSLSYEESLNLRSYTGYNFKNINAILRNNWMYEVNGVLTQEKSEEFRKLSIIVENILNKFIMPKIDFVAFRGTTISSFSNYGISDISQLDSLKGKFLYEQGFTSTSILEDSCYFNKKLDDGRFCNIEIKYLIPSESNDGALLVSDDTSYSTNQNEFLLNKDSLSKVIDVKIDKNLNCAILTVVLVPKKIYDLNYNKKSSRNL